MVGCHRAAGTQAGGSCLHCHQRRLCDGGGWYLCPAVEARSFVRRLSYRRRSLRRRPCGSAKAQQRGWGGDDRLRGSGTNCSLGSIAQTAGFGLCFLERIRLVIQNQSIGSIEGLVAGGGRVAVRDGWTSCFWTIDRPRGADNAASFDACGAAAVCLLSWVAAEHRAELRLWERGCAEAVPLWRAVPLPSVRAVSAGRAAAHGVAQRRKGDFRAYRCCRLVVAGCSRAGPTLHNW